MSKINIDNISVEVIGTTVHLDMPPNYSLQINHKINVPSSVRHVQQTYTFDKHTSSLANQIDQVEKSGNGPWNK